MILILQIAAGVIIGGLVLGIVGTVVYIAIMVEFEDALAKWSRR